MDVSREASAPKAAPVGLGIVAYLHGDYKHAAVLMGLYRVVAQSYLDLSALSEKSGDLQEAASETEQGVRYFSMVGDTIYLPTFTRCSRSAQGEDGSGRRSAPALRASRGRD